MALDSKHLANVSKVKQMLARKDIQLFDVRTAPEHAAGKIDGSTNVPLDEIGTAFALPDDEFQRKYGVKKPSKDDSNIVVHCRSGVRSETALRQLLGMGYKNAAHLVGGFIAYGKS